MKSGAPYSPSQTAENHPLSIAPVTERKSTQLGFFDFAKSALLVALITKLSSLVGYTAGRAIPITALPKSLRKFKVIEIEGIKHYPFAFWAGVITGSVGGFYETWKRWRKVKGQEFGVQNIHKDIYTILDPAELKSEMEQNQRIQDGIQTLVSSPRNIQPRGAYTEAAIQDRSEKRGASYEI